MADRTIGISIHAPREGSDFIFHAPPPKVQISIHAPREGSDSRPALRVVIQEDFNPRSPRGERHHHQERLRCLDCISIHAPREGSD